MTEAHTPSPPQPSAALLKGKKRTSGPSWPILLAIIFLLVAFVTSGGAWFLQKRFEQTGREFAKQVQGLTSQLNEARQDSTQALGQAQSQAGRIAQLEQAQLEAKSQFVALEQLWAGANKGMEDVMLANDVDRLLTTANQQLRLAGNVNNAIVTLEAAQSLLVRADRARFDGVQRAISLDLDRLRSVPLIDITQLSSRLETLSALVARAPLLLPDAAAPLIASEAPSVQRVPTPSESAQAPSPALTAAEQTWWQRALDQSLLWSKSAAALVVREFAGVVSIQRVSDANALMMSPEQGALLRANLRTRVLTAQMALLMNQAPVWRAELAQVQQSLVSRFDPKATDTIAALRLVQELAAIQIAVSLPSIKDSLSALESVRSSEPSPAGGQ
jgi:uroporphyrin-3 C-methyltransferase